MIEPLAATTTGDRAVPGRRAGVLSPLPDEHGRDSESKAARQSEGSREYIWQLAGLGFETR